MGAAAYPNPTSPAVTAVMKANRRRDTGPELRLRSALHRLGARYRKDHPIALAGRRPVRADIAFTRARVAVFVDGCFWHACPDHGTRPQVNTAYWEPKLRRNVERDRDVDAALRVAGWTVVRVWEHEGPEDVAVAICRQLRAADRRSGHRPADS